ncbi:hypothetical protein HZA75_07865 [Candidatus Roizmanbacteria bacterium]|nr:hypothetical protein [Candidatus Roizmanbacteria bacterium]
MKNKIKPFIRRLIRENIFYIIGNVFIFILIIITIKIGFTENFRYDKKITTLKTELNQLQNKVTLMNTTIPSSDKLDEDLKLLNTLIPNIEDYFSIIYALEKLSQKSNFIITSYNVNVGNSTSEKIKLEVTGSGDSQSFINFLRDYNFGGGRLITSDKIKLDPNFFGSIKIDLTFYSKNVLTGKNLELSADEKIFKELETLKNKVNFSFESNTATNSPDFNYPKKSNPF